jgi:hypothetical protein
MVGKALSALSVLALIIFAAAVQLVAQSTGTLTGTVIDPSGAVVSGAEVACVNTNTQFILRAVTNQSGLFRFSDVPVGSYEITASRAGFADLRRSGIQLLTEHTVNLTLALRLGEISQSVLVDAPAPLVQAATSDVQSTIDSRQMRDLPLNGRNAFQLAELTPGAIGTDATTSQATRTTSRSR